MRPVLPDGLPLSAVLAVEECHRTRRPPTGLSRHAGKSDSMDTWLYYDVLHALHTYCNPVSERGVRDLERVLQLGPGSRVLDIASGHGEMLVGFAERSGSAGVGVDCSPYAHRRAEARRAERVPDADVTFVFGRGEEYRPGDGETFDVAMCIGASWIWSGYEGTLRALVGFVRPGGLVVSGEPFWMAPPTPEYCEVAGCEAEQFHDLDGCRAVAEDLGLEVVWMRRSTGEEWDRYEMTQLVALDRFERENPDHPDLAISFHELSQVLRAQNELAAARQACERALRLCQEKYGPYHDNVSVVLGTLGNILRAMGNPRAAARAYRRQFEILKRSLPTDHPDLDRVRDNLAACKAERFKRSKRHQK